MKSLISLQQWQTLAAVVEHGGYAQAAEAMDKSQSAVSYAIQKLEDNLGIRVFRLQGRRAVLTSSGEILHQRARLLLEHALSLEDTAHQLSIGWPPRLRLAVDALFPSWMLLDALSQFSQRSPLTRIEILETILSGTDDALIRREVDLAISPRIPQGFTGDALMQIQFLAVAHPEHPLHALGRPLSWRDLRQHRQLVVRDSGSQQLNAGWLDAEQRWTMSHLSTSIQAACMGLGFAWYPEPRIRKRLDGGQLKILPLEEGSVRYATLYRIYANPDFPGPACRELASMLTQAIAQSQAIR